MNIPAPEAKEETYTPKSCINCKYHRGGKLEIIGWKIFLPYGWWEVEGCIFKKLCPVKKVRFVMIDVPVASEELRIIKSYVDLYHLHLHKPDSPLPVLTDNQKRETIKQLIKSIGKKFHRTEKHRERLEKVFHLYEKLNVTGLFVFPFLKPQRWCRRCNIPAETVCVFDIRGLYRSTSFTACFDVKCSSFLSTENPQRMEAEKFFLALSLVEEPEDLGVILGSKISLPFVTPYIVVAILLKRIVKGTDLKKELSNPSQEVDKTISLFQSDPSKFSEAVYYFYNT